MAFCLPSSPSNTDMWPRYCPDTIGRLTRLASLHRNPITATQMSIDQAPVNPITYPRLPRRPRRASRSHGTFRGVSRAPNTPDGRRMASISGREAPHEACQNACHCSTGGKHRRCPVGGIGRHTWFRSKRESMGVRVPHRAPSSLDVNPRRHARLPRRRSGSSRATVPGERQGSRLLREAALAVAHHPKDTCAPDAGRLFRSCKNPLAFSEPHCADCPLLKHFCRGGG